MRDSDRLLVANLAVAAVQLRYMPRALRLDGAGSRRWAAASVALPVVQSLFPLSVVYLTRDLVDALVPVMTIGTNWVFVRRSSLTRCWDEASYRPVALFESGRSFLQNSVTLVAMAAVLVP